MKDKYLSCELNNFYELPEAAIGNTRKPPDTFYEALSHFDINKYYLNDLEKGSHLTRKEMDCLLLLLAGYTAKQIARKFNLSYRTVEPHINNIKRKTQSGNMQALRKKFSSNQFINALQEFLNIL